MAQKPTSIPGYWPAYDTTALCAVSVTFLGGQLPRTICRNWILELCPKIGMEADTTVSYVFCFAKNVPLKNGREAIFERRKPVVFA
jgi:hypothetical protein